jgi:hypothetical protein
MRILASRALWMVLACAFIALSFGGIARAQSPEPGSFFEIDPMVALNGFAVLAGAIVLLFEVYRKRP